MFVCVCKRALKVRPTILAPCSLPCHFLLALGTGRVLEPKKLGGHFRGWRSRFREVLDAEAAARLEDEEGAGAALSVLCVVPTLPKYHHQEVTQEGPTPGPWQKETATFGANSISIKKCISKKCRPLWDGSAKAEISTS